MSFRGSTNPCLWQMFFPRYQVQLLPSLIYFPSSLNAYVHPPVFPLNPFTSLEARILHWASRLINHVLPLNISPLSYAFRIFNLYFAFFTNIHPLLSVLLKHNWMIVSMTVLSKSLIIIASDMTRLLVTWAELAFIQNYILPFLLCLDMICHEKLA